MKAVLIIPDEQFDDLIEHLLPRPHEVEQAAFVFAEVKFGKDEVILEYRYCLQATAEDFVIQSEYHIELSEGFISKVIKRAHDLKCCLVEFHSHVNQKSARFSSTDWSGFSEFVPYVMWRLKDRPYVSVVTSTNRSIDALAWIDDPKKPQVLSMINTGRKKVMPTNNSLKKGKYDW